MEKIITYVEFGIDGHQMIWLRSVINAFERLMPDWKLNIWLPNECLFEFQKYCRPYFNVENISKNIRVRSHEDLCSSSKKNVGIKPRRFKTVQQCMDIDYADVCFIALNLDACLKDIAFSRLNRCKAKLVGVLSQPFLHYINFTSYQTKRWLTKSRYLKTYIKTFIMCHRSIMGEVLVLDPLAQDYYNLKLQTSKFRFLPEYRILVEPISDSRKHFNIPEGRQIILFTGNIARRKGAIEFVKAFQKVLVEHKHLKDQLTVVFAGLIMEDVRDTFYKAISELHSVCPNFPILIIDRYLTDDEFITLIAISDLICMPYINFIGSSGILMNAAAWGRPVLASEFGLVGELVRCYNLGIACNTSSVSELARAVYKAINEFKHIDDERRQAIKAFATKYSLPLDQFGEEIFSSLLRVVSKIR
jgi:glycosyltransferase involved in cell wall biosynthesis